jgi:hypothetical protein
VEFNPLLLFTQLAERAVSPLEIMDTEEHIRGENEQEELVSLEDPKRAMAAFLGQNSSVTANTLFEHLMRQSQAPPAPESTPAAQESQPAGAQQQLTDFPEEEQEDDDIALSFPFSPNELSS